MKTPLIALKPLTHAGKRYAPGESFVALRRDARILMALKRARRDEGQPVKRRARAKPVPKPEPVVEQPETQEPAATVEDMPQDLWTLTNAELRALARREGVSLEGRENKAELVRKIEENRSDGGTYSRRDMRAED